MTQDPIRERRHRQRIERYTQKVRRLYEAAVRDFAILAASTNFDITKPFKFSDYPSASEYLQKILNHYAGTLKAIIEKGTSAEFYQAMKEGQLQGTSNSVYNTQNRQALKAFQTRTQDGMSLSTRVWKYTDQLQSEIELALSTGIGKGTSARELAQQTQKLLNEPDKLFRRVRDEHGILHLSKNAKAYNPGQGVYRSSYKNALRLTRNETNIAYRTADHNRWKNDNTIIGFEVKLSNRHTVRDICDDLKGQYPKGFKFTGWHPNCLCYMVPIVVNDEDFDVLQMSTLKNETLPNDFAPAGMVTDVPDGFKEWVKVNTEKSKRWKSQPYFIQDNFKSGRITGGMKDEIK